MRFTLASQASPGTDIAFSEARTEGYRAFANKIWNAARFLFMNIDRAREAGIAVVLPGQAGGAAERAKGFSEAIPPSREEPLDSTLDAVAVDHSLTGKLANLLAASTPHGEAVLQTGNIDLANQSASAMPHPPVGSEAGGGAAVRSRTQPLEAQWILTRLSQTAGAVNASLAEYRFDEAASHVYQFFWGDLCDWYLEIVKLRLVFEDAEAKASTAAALGTLIEVFEAALRLLSPFMPFLTEEIWHALYAGAPPAKSIALTRYPQQDDYAADAGSIKAMQVMQDLITTIRGLRKELAVPEKEPAGVRVHAEEGVLSTVKGNSDMLTRLARVSDVQYTSEASSGSGSRSTAAFDVQVVYERQIDVPAERERLTKEIVRLDKILAANDARLGDEKFLGKAPAHIVDGLRKQTDEMRTLRDKAEAALGALPDV